MTCEHLHPFEKELSNAGIPEIFRGKAWTDNCREWVYYDCVFTNLEKTMARFRLDKEYMKVHSHIGTHDGHEYGLVCVACKDGIMGKHPDVVKKSFSPVIEFE